MKNGNSQERTPGAGKRKSGGRQKHQGGKAQARGADGRQSQKQGKDLCWYSSATRKPGIVRPKWTPPAIPEMALPTRPCPLCSKPINDMAAAFTDKATGEAVHFDCIRQSLAKSESLVEGDVIAYIGGGRFGVVYHENNAPHSFRIRRIIDWEPTEKRAPWRTVIADHFSVT